MNRIPLKKPTTSVSKPPYHRIKRGINRPMQEQSMDKGPVITIALITAISLLGNEMLIIVMPIYWKFFGLDSLWQIGVLLSINRFIRIPINSFVGWCYHRISKRTGVLVAVFLAALSTYSYGVLKGFAILLVVRIVWGVAWSFLRLGGFLTVIACSTLRTRGQLIGLYNGLWGLGTLFGVLIGGLFSDLIGIQFITTVFAILAFLTLPLVVKFIPNTPSVEREEETTEQRSIFKSRPHRKVLFNGFLVSLIVAGIFFSTLSKIVEYHMSEEVVIWGFTIGAATIAGIVQSVKTGSDPFLAPAIGRWSDIRFGRITPLMISFFIGAILFGFIPITSSFILFIGLLFLFQIVATFLVTTSDSLATDLSEGPLSVKMITYYTLFADLGAAMGPFISYIVLDFIGLPWLYWSTSLILFLAALYWYREYRLSVIDHEGIRKMRM